MLKIKVFVEGGCVTDVEAEDEGNRVEYELEIVDYDNIDEDERIQEEKDRKNGLYGPEYDGEQF
jgi:hypothetical protein